MFVFGNYYSRDWRHVSSAVNGGLDTLQRRTVSPSIANWYCEYVPSAGTARPIGGRSRSSERPCERFNLLVIARNNVRLAGNREAEKSHCEGASPKQSPILQKMRLLRRFTPRNDRVKPIAQKFRGLLTKKVFHHSCRFEATYVSNQRWRPPISSLSL